MHISMGVKKLGNIITREKKSSQKLKTSRKSHSLKKKKKKTREEKQPIDVDVLKSHSPP